jgi:hypothetical protein
MLRQGIIDMVLATEENEVGGLTQRGPPTRAA